MFAAALTVLESAGLSPAMHGVAFSLAGRGVRGAAGFLRRPAERLW